MMQERPRNCGLYCMQAGRPHREEDRGRWRPLRGENGDRKRCLVPGSIVELPAGAKLRASLATKEHKPVKDGLGALSYLAGAWPQSCEAGGSRCGK